MIHIRGFSWKTDVESPDTKKMAKHRKLEGCTEDPGGWWSHRVPLLIDLSNIRACICAETKGN